MRILYVCTANICRSASAQRLLREAVANLPELAGIEVQSAGTHARPGSPGCSVSPALAGHAAEHHSQALTADLVAWADLILPAARDHRPSILELEPTSRVRTFTIRQAGRIADWMVDSGMVAAGVGRAAWGGDPVGWASQFAIGDPRRDVQPLPDDPGGRWSWVVSEMDAARGLTGVPVPAESGEGAVPARSGEGAVPAESGEGAVPAESGEGAVPARSRRRWWRARDPGMAGGQGARAPASGGSTDGQGAVDPSALHADDVPDPHYLGTGLHPLAYRQLAGSTDALVRLLREVAVAG